MIIGISFVSFNYAPKAMAANFDSCINNTEDEAKCKDCCDCLENSDERKSCRDNCATHDFSQNSDFITVDAPSILGPDGDYSVAIATGSEQECKEYCDTSSELSCGDRRYCRDACNTEFSGSGDPDNGISIEQAISDEAQMKTIAFSGLAFLTGDLCSYTFFPPGKISDFFGFQYLRDVTPNGFGHNTEFAGRIADSVLSILSEAQVLSLVNMANTQAEQVDAYGYKRFVMIKAFRRLLDNDLPDDAVGINKSALKDFAADLYEIDGEISYSRAKVIGGIVAGLSDTQKTKLTELQLAFNTLFENAGEGGTINSEDWPTADPVDLSGLTVNDGRVLVSTYATQLFSWYLGSVEGDTYFCPERHGTYFGSFYMKDIPPLLSTEAVTIDSNLTADMGTAFMNALDYTQNALVANLVDIQKSDLNNIVSKRQEISEKLRLFMSGTSVDKDQVLTLLRQYGEYEGEMMYYYASNFAAVGNSLTTDQANTVMEIRLNYYEKFPDYQANSNAYDCSGAWLYASKIDMPEIENTDFLFGEENSSVTDGTIEKLADTFTFAEGPAADSQGNIFFSDISANRIYKWTVDGTLSIFKENSGGANGLFFDAQDNLIACEGTNSRLVSIDSQGNISVLADEYNAISLNEPNDLWIDPKGGIYFSDPIYFKDSTIQDGEHVYYLMPDRDNLLRVVNDMTKPNGIIGSPDHNILYVADHGAEKVYKYEINQDGSFSNKTLFVSKKVDGISIDNEGNIYLTTESGVLVYNSSANLIETITVPKQPTNLCFGGSDGHTLFITAKTSVYFIKMRVKGVSQNWSEKGDIDMSGSVDIGDVILGLQIITDTEQSNINKEAEVNQDGMIGIQDVIYIFVKLCSGE